MFGVVMGAFGAHLLDDLLAANGYMDVYQTAVKYQFYHALGLILTGLLALQFTEQKLVKASSLLMFVGTIIFSGSLYLLTITNTKWLGAITPIGGVMLIISWLLLTLSVLRAKSKTNA